VLNFIPATTMVLGFIVLEPSAYTFIAVEQFPRIFDKQPNELPSLLQENFMAAVNYRLH
jgi:hypothetical protein